MVSYSASVVATDEAFVLQYIVDPTYIYGIFECKKFSRNVMGHFSSISSLNEYV